MKRLIYIVFLSFISLSAFGQNNTATSSGNGTWLQASSWNADPGVSTPPNGSWANGEYIIIQNTIDIANNKTVNLSTSSLKVLRITNTGTLIFKSNSKLILPENTIIILESGAQIDASNNSGGTLIQIGENPVWGRQACNGCNGELTGYGRIDKNSDPNNPLPIKLLSFTGTTINNTIQLDWITAWEENFDFFTIERAGADLKFEAIGTLKGSGNTTAEVPYSYTDQKPMQGQAFYRLKATDYDGSVEYHKIISVFFDGFAITATKAYPNPVTNRILKVETTASELHQAKLLDMSGRTVYAQTIQMGTNEISLPELIRPGAYMLIISGDQGQQHQQRIMVL